ncbi:MAG TPA: hypothetical protein V6C81_12710 [Planktothrix sp.]|jgi:hypothetical protein
MKWIIAAFTGGFGLIWVAVSLLSVVAWVYGAILTFKASVVLGIVGFFFLVPYPIEAICHVITGYDIAQHLARALGLS